MLTLFVLLTITATIISGQEPGPKICQENELWRECSSCEGKCNDMRYECRHSCQEPKCECPHDLGYVRADDGRCVYHTFCPKIQEDYFHRCHDNRIWHMCSGCEASCEDPQPECPQICLEASCECPRELGFAIRQDGKCVPRALCAPDQAAAKSFHHPPPPPDSHPPFGPGPVRHQLPLGPGPVHHQLPLGPGPVQGVGPRSRMLIPPPVESQPLPLGPGPVRHQPPLGPGPVRHQLPLGPGPVHQHSGEESQSQALVGGQRPLPLFQPRDKFQPPPPVDDHPVGGPGPVLPHVPAHDGPGPVVPPRPDVVGGQRPVPVIGPKS